MTTRDDLIVILSKWMDGNVTSDKLVNKMIEMQLKTGQDVLKNTALFLDTHRRKPETSYEIGWNDALNHAIGYIVTLVEIIEKDVESRKTGNS